MFSLAFPLALCLLLLPATTAQCDGGSILYFPPDLSETPRVLIDDASPTQTSVGVLYIFPMDISTFHCDGTVLQIEYCYSYSSNRRMMSLPVFTLYLLEQTAMHFNQINSMVFSSTPSLAEECVSSSRRCCERQSLQDNFLSSASLPLVFGVAVSANSHSLLSDTDLGNYFIHNVAELPSINRPLPPAAQQYRLVRFVIDPAIAPTSTTAPSTSSSEPQPTEPSSNPESSSEPPTEPSSNTQSSSEPPTEPSSNTESSSEPPTEPSSNPESSSEPPTEPSSNPESSSEPPTEATETNPTPTVSSSSPTPTPSGSPSGRAGGSIAAGVIVSLLVVVGAGVAFAVVAVVLWRRSRDKQQPAPPFAAGDGGFDNRVYASETLVTKFSAGKRSSDAVAIVGPSQPAEDEFHEYEAPEALNLPQEYEMAQHRKSEAPTHSRVNPYANTLTGVGNAGNTSTMMLDPEIIYEVPATDENSLYTQFRRIDIKHIPRSSIQLQEVIGSGQFGTVQRGVWRSQSEGEVDVAIKMLNKGSNEMDKVKFLQEAAIMGQFQHPSIVKLHGVAILGEPKMIVLELLPLGDLRKILIELRPSNGGEVEQGLSHTLLSYCRQVASGMNYLAGKAFVHRDLAARNILVSEDGDIKIADFGMSRDLLEESYYVSHGGKIPVKWTAPEALHYKKYSTASDVWSFGAVMYEIWSLGHKPFEAYSNHEAISMLDSGVRLPPPPGCPRAIYALMIKCWHSAASERPDFPRIVQHLSLSDTKLLKWAEQDRTAAPAEAASLGAELKAAVDLYKELQNAYLNSEL